MFRIYIIVLAMLQINQAIDEAFYVKKCTIGVNSQLTKVKKEWFDELLKPETVQIWHVKYAFQSQINSKTHNTRWMVKEMNITILPPDKGVTEIQFSGVWNSDRPCKPHSEYTVEVEDKMFLTSLEKEGTPRFKYYILHDKPNRYMYIYKCSINRGDEGFDGDERYVIFKEGGTVVTRTEETNEINEIIAYDKSLKTNWVFRERLTEVKKREL